MFVKTVGLLCLLIVSISALPAEETRGHSRNAVNSDNDLMDSIYSDCLRKDSVSCVKYKLFSFVDKMIGARDTFALTEGVTVVKVPGSEQEGAPRAINTDDSIESLIMSRIQSFLKTHTVKVELKGAEIVNAVSSTGRALEDVSESVFGDDEQGEGRGKKKKAAKILGPLLAMVALKAAALLPLLLGAIALIAGKALLIGKIALVLSAIIGLKKLLSGGQEKHVTYEVVAHPHHTSSHTTSHGDSSSSYGGGFSGGDAGGYGGSSGGSHGWGRAYDAQDLAYKSQKP
ncbi:CLUMA_CG005668, isoform A [Clunio marinus]|uniref:CLUMA_CG005668, isoform A n=1 Tax=Clunio marinus TaxID=568069 RepID=A0A1J1I169_9DIPT|nr:CLUMA_CG005668, isoform A [Clunio marinus]